MTTIGVHPSSYMTASMLVDTQVGGFHLRPPVHLRNSSCNQHNKDNIVVVIVLPCTGNHSILIVIFVFIVVVVVDALWLL